jgi:hypothetical protein
MLHTWVQEKFVEEDIYKPKKNARVVASVDHPFITNYGITFMQKKVKVSTTKNA